MISIRKSTDDLDRLENLRTAMADCFGLAVQSSAEYAVEVDSVQAARFRARLSEVGDRWRAAAEPGELRIVGTSFRGELRDYQKSAEQSLLTLRREVDAAAAAIAAFASNVALNGADHDEQLKRELDRLSTASQSSDLGKIRSAIQAAISHINTALEQMRLSNRMVVAQLQDEIRLLHHEIDVDRPRTLNPASLIRTRDQFTRKIEEALAKQTPFCLLLIAVSNWKAEVKKRSAPVADAAVAQMISRLHSNIDPDLIVGRWNEAEFITLLSVDPGTAISISREVSQRLSGIYEVTENGERGIIELKVKAGVIDRAASPDSEDFQTKLASLSAALRRA